MMKPPEIEEGMTTAGQSTEEGGEAPGEAKYTHEQVTDAITTTLTSRQFRFALKRTDVENAEVETQWRDEEAFEGGGPGTYGGEDKYRSFVVVSFDFARNRVNIERTAQQMDFYINDWRDVQPRRYHRDEDMQIQKVIMEVLEQSPAGQ
jgi:hypothetical protein